MHSGNLSHFFQEDGKTVILPIDHGTAIPVPGMEKPGQLIEAVKPHVDGFVVNLGMARAFATELSGKGVCLRTDVYKPDNPDGAYRIYGVDEAEEVGATAMMQMLYPDHANETEITRECAETIAEAVEAGMATIIETLPVGLGLPDDYTVENIIFAARMAAELGADVVKTAFPTGASADDFRRIVDSVFVPVIILGGAAMGDDEELLTLVRKAMDGGASGIAVGRNVWMHADPASIARKLAAVVHDGASVEQALKA